jgi:hypothetical protein
MNREEIVYNNIMQNIAFVVQNKPITVQLKDIAISYINALQNLFSFSDKIALATICIVCICLSHIQSTSTNTQQINEDSIYTLIYETDINY